VGRVGLIALIVLAGCQQPNLSPKPLLKVKVVVFTATWCRPCQKAKPILVQIRARGVEVQVVDIDVEPALAKQCGVTQVPTFLLLVDNMEVARTHDMLTIMAWSGHRR